MENIKNTNGPAHCVRLVPIFNHLDDESMDKIGSMANHQKYKRGELIYQAEEDSDTLYIINKGKVKICTFKKKSAKEPVKETVKESVKDTEKDPVKDAVKAAKKDSVKIK